MQKRGSSTKDVKVVLAWLEKIGYYSARRSLEVESGVTDYDIPEAFSSAERRILARLRDLVLGGKWNDAETLVLPALQAAADASAPDCRCTPPTQQKMKREEVDNYPHICHVPDAWKRLIFPLRFQAFLERLFELPIASVNYPLLGSDKTLAPAAHPGGIEGCHTGNPSQKQTGNLEDPMELINKLRDLRALAVSGYGDDIFPDITVTMGPGGGKYEASDGDMVRGATLSLEVTTTSNIFAGLCGCLTVPSLNHHPDPLFRSWTRDRGRASTVRRVLRVVGLILSEGKVDVNVPSGYTLGSTTGNNYEPWPSESSKGELLLPIELHRLVGREAGATLGLHVNQQKVTEERRDGEENNAMQREGYEGHGYTQLVSEAGGMADAGGCTRDRGGDNNEEEADKKKILEESVGAIDKDGLADNTGEKTSVKGIESEAPYQGERRQLVDEDGSSVEEEDGDNGANMSEDIGESSNFDGIHMEIDAFETRLRERQQPNQTKSGGIADPDHQDHSGPCCDKEKVSECDQRSEYDHVSECKMMIEKEHLSNSPSQGTMTLPSTSELVYPIPNECDAGGDGGKRKGYRGGKDNDDDDDIDVIKYMPDGGTEALSHIVGSKIHGGREMGGDPEGERSNEEEDEDEDEDEDEGEVEEKASCCEETKQEGNGNPLRDQERANMWADASEEDRANSVVNIPTSNPGNCHSNPSEKGCIKEACTTQANKQEGCEPDDEEGGRTVDDALPSAYQGGEGGQGGGDEVETAEREFTHKVEETKDTHQRTIPTPALPTPPSPTNVMTLLCDPRVPIRALAFSPSCDTAMSWLALGTNARALHLCTLPSSSAPSSQSPSTRMYANFHMGSIYSLSACSIPKPPSPSLASSTTCPILSSLDSLVSPFSTGDVSALLAVGSNHPAVKLVVLRPPSTPLATPVEDLPHPAERALLLGHNGTVRVVHFLSPLHPLSSPILASAGAGDYVIRVWDCSHCRFSTPVNSLPPRRKSSATPDKSGCIASTVAEAPKHYIPPPQTPVAPTKESEACIARLHGHTSPIYGLATNTKAPMLLVSAAQNGTISLWDMNPIHSASPSNPAQLKPFLTLDAPAQASSVALSVNLSSPRIVVACGLVNGTLALWDLTDYCTQFLSTPPRSSSTTPSLVPSPVMTTSGNAIPNNPNPTASSQPLHLLPIASGDIRSLHTSSDGDTLLVSSFDGTLATVALGSLTITPHIVTLPLGSHLEAHRQSTPTPASHGTWSNNRPISAGGKCSNVPGDEGSTVDLGSSDLATDNDKDKQGAKEGEQGKEGDGGREKLTLALLHPNYPQTVAFATVSANGRALYHWG